MTHQSVLSFLMKKVISILALIFLVSCGPAATSSQNPAVSEPTPMSKLYTGLAITKGDGAVLGMYTYGGDAVYYGHENKKCDPASIADITERQMAIWNTNTCGWQIIGEHDQVEISGTWSSMLSALTGDNQQVILEQTNQDIAVDVTLVSYDSTRKYPLYVEVQDEAKHSGWISLAAFFRTEFYAGHRTGIPLKQGEGYLMMYTQDGHYGKYLLNSHNYCVPSDYAADSTDQYMVWTWDVSTCSWIELTMAQPSVDLIAYATGPFVFRKDMTWNDSGSVINHDEAFIVLQVFYDGTRPWMQVKSETLGIGWIDLWALQTTPWNKQFIKQEQNTMHG